MSEKKFLIIDSRPYGLFSIFLHTLDNIKWAKDNGYIPVVRWGPGRRDPNLGREGAREASMNGHPKHVVDKTNFLTEEKPSSWNNTPGMKHCQCLYWSEEGWNDSKNPWEYYFEPLNEYTVQQALEGKHDISDIFMSGELDFDLQNKFLIANIHSYEPLKLWNLLDTEHEASHRKDVYKTIKENIKLKHGPTNKINDFYNSNFLKGFKTLAVHVRGTDKKLEYPHKALPLQDYIASIQTILDDDKEIGNLYIASDNNEAIGEIIKNFKEKVKKIIVYPAVRMPKYFSKDPICLTGATGPEHGEEVLVETNLLAKSDYLVCTDSNVSAAAIFMNPDIKVRFLNRKYGF